VFDPEAGEVGEGNTSSFWKMDRVRRVGLNRLDGSIRKTGEGLAHAPVAAPEPGSPERSWFLFPGSQAEWLPLHPLGQAEGLVQPTKRYTGASDGPGWGCFPQPITPCFR